MQVGDLAVYSSGKNGEIIFMSHPASKCFPTLVCVFDKKPAIFEPNPLQRACIIKHGTIYRPVPSFSSDSTKTEGRS